MELKQGDVVLCEFFFADMGVSKKRPVLVFKDNLPFDDFVGIPLSSKIKNLNADERLIEQQDFLAGELPKVSKLMVRKTFVISKSVVIKKYGTIKPDCFAGLHHGFCQYFGCC